MTEIDFYLEIARNKEVMGATIGSSRESFDSNLGHDYVEDKRKNRLRLDYGILEAFFTRNGGEWICTGFTAQIHRLQNSGADIIPHLLKKQYGSFSTPTEWPVVKQAIEASGCTVTQDDQHYSGEFNRFHVQPSGATVITNPAPETEQETVWSIEVSQGS